MRITNEGKTRRIEFIKMESEKAHFPSHRIEVELETENIRAGFRESVWLSESDIEAFLNDLTLLEESRKGQAVLESMSQEELKLTIRAIDKAGHLSVQLQLLKEDRLHRDYSYSVQVEFQIDPTALPLIGKELEELLQ